MLGHPTNKAVDGKTITNSRFAAVFLELELSLEWGLGKHSRVICAFPPTHAFFLSFFLPSSWASAKQFLAICTATQVWFVDFSLFPQTKISWRSLFGLKRSSDWILLTFFFPRLVGRGMVSLHAHNGPVKFLVMATAVCNHLPDVLSPSLPSLPQPSEPQDVDGDRPPSDSATPSSQGHGVWLGEAGCTAMALQDSLSSSSCGSLAPSQGSLEHGPEDGALYDTIHDAAHHQRARRSSKVDVSSLLVVSGGLGHRRVTKKTKPSRHEDNTSTIMIWQIPLLSMWHHILTHLRRLSKELFKPELYLAL